MLIFGAIIFPVLFMLYMMIWHRKEVKMWEIALQFGVCILVIFMAKFAAEGSRTDDIEWWGNLGTQIQYDESWNELVHYTVQVYAGQT